LFAVFSNSYIDYALSHPAARVVLVNLQLVIRRRLDFGAGLVSCSIENLTPDLSLEPAAVNFNVEPAKNHFPYSHLAEQRIEPVNKQKLAVFILTAYFDRLNRSDFPGRTYYRRHRHGSLGKRLLARSPEAPYADIRGMTEMFPHCKNSATLSNISPEALL
jgi:hypothetical protein